jgi:hypothetical protein
MDVNDSSSEPRIAGLERTIYDSRFTKLLFTKPPPASGNSAID